MCTLSRDDTQSPINPAAATAARDKWKPRPAELPAPPPLSTPPPALLSTSSHCQGYPERCTLWGISTLYFPSSQAVLSPVQPELKVSHPKEISAPRWESHTTGKSMHPTFTPWQDQTFPPIVFYSPLSPHCFVLLQAKYSKSAGWQ